MIVLFIILGLMLVRAAVSETFSTIGRCNDPQDSSPCSTTKPWQQHNGVCYFNRDKGINKCISPRPQVFRFVIEAKYRRGKGNNIPPLKQLYLRGSGSGLSWERAIEMRKSKTMRYTWTTNIEYTMDADGLLCVEHNHCILNQGALEFRLYKGQAGEDQMRGPNFYFNLPIPNSLAGSTSFKPPVISVYPWFTQSYSSTTVFKPHYSLHLLGISRWLPKIDSTIIFPPSFHENIYRRYPLVILFNDQSRSYYPLLEYLYLHTPLIEEVILVTVTLESYLIGKYGSRFSVLPFHNASTFTCRNNICQEDCNKCFVANRVEPCDKEEYLLRSRQCYSLRETRGIGESMMIHMIDQIINKLQSKHKRIMYDPPIDRLTLIGYGETALSAFVTGLSRPDIIGNVAALSPPFYLPFMYRFDGVKSETLKLMDYYAARASKNLQIQTLYSTQKYYISQGENEGIYFPVENPLQITTKVIEKLQKEFHVKTGVNLMYQIIPGEAFTYPFKPFYPLMSILQTPLMFFHESRSGGLSATYTQAINLTESFFASRLSVTLSTQATDNNNNVSLSNLSDIIGHKTAGPSTPQCSSYTAFAITTYMGSISLSVIVSVIVTVVLMYLREESRQSVKEEENDDQNLLEGLSSLEDL